MTITTLATASRVQKWDSQFLSEYVRTSRFMPYMGKASGRGITGSNDKAVILIKTELTTAGKIVNIPLITRLKGTGVQGNTVLIGSEEALSNYNMPIHVNYNRNGVSIPEADEHWTEMDLRGAAKGTLRTWAAESLRNDIIISLMSPDGTAYVQSLDATAATGTVRTPAAWWDNQISANQAGLDTWLTNNEDRVLFGTQATVTGDFSASALLLTDGTDGMSAATIDAAKNLAKTADPHITPMSVDDANGREYYVMFMSTADFANAKKDATIQAYNKDARPREVSSNPVFQDGDLIYDGVILREVPEIPTGGAIGVGGDVASQSFLCGAQALAVAWGMRPQSRTAAETDYGHFAKMGVTECRGVAKTFFDGKQHGVVSVYSTAAPNA